ncbi:universal stress protein [Staphylococcus xylosus]|uniref:universal stress protein n=1 Tax=Staphylococcus xylosus TaxID=1288 RepID=UPI0003476B97|nr:universal stress protein [Staphylococcus xylosus]MBF0812514.1 universal stress protein [Staphylococcus saprophyticus]MRF37642.1 universal stress protein [Staphylococcus sp. KY49P]NQD99798.1 universal stress protein [Staphylococcus xylosus]TFV25467.1 universal stress protein [Staphylococcus saprophyticus]
MYKNILLAYDFDNSFNNVPEELQNLTAGVDDAEITVFHVIPESELETSVRYDNKHFEDLAHEKSELLEPFVNKLEDLGLNVNIRFSTGYIKNSILSEINEHSYDIIVMSNTRTKSDIKNILGNVTHKIASNVDIPVLIVN